MFISRYNRFGQSITTLLFQRAQEIEKEIMYLRREIENNPEKRRELSRRLSILEQRCKIINANENTRLDHLAYEHYNESLNWWIIAAASGIGWWLNLKKDGEYVKLYILSKDEVESFK